MNINITYSPVFPLIVLFVLVSIIVVSFFLFAPKVKTTKQLVLAIVGSVVLCGIASAVQIVPLVNTRNDFIATVTTQAKEVYGIELTEVQASDFSGHFLAVGESSDVVVDVVVDGEVQMLRLYREAEQNYLLMIQEEVEFERQ